MDPRTIELDGGRRQQDTVACGLGWSCKTVPRVVVLSNDTDTFALLLHYAPYLQTLGLKDIWQQHGTGEKRRMLPLHQAVSQLGAPFVKTVIQAHILTGDNCMSKVGTQHAAMTCNPVQYLTHFGETPTLFVRA